MVNLNNKEKLGKKLKSNVNERYGSKVQYEAKIPHLFVTWCYFLGYFSQICSQKLVYIRAGEDR